MLESEFIKSMDKNFERVHLEKKPEEKRYQYCIISRGGIRGLLECSLRFINGDAFLYYDITSKQNLSQIMKKKKIDREWLSDFAWNLNHIRQEMNRFLLNDSNVIWFPEQIYRDLDENRWSFIYYPYYEGESGFNRFLEFVIEKLDYDDDKLVECAYKIYEQYEENGDAYLKEKIFDDIRKLEKKKPKKAKTLSALEESAPNVSDPEEMQVLQDRLEQDREAGDDTPKITEPVEIKMKAEPEEAEPPKTKEPRKGLFALLENARRRDRETRERVKRENHYLMENGDIPMVAEEKGEYGEDDEDDDYDEEYGKTIYMENIAEAKDETRRLYDEKGSVLAVLGENPIVIGKKKGEADIIVDNSTVSRVHARIVYENETYLIEDLNSTNGTFKNGLRLRPYERRKLTEGDEIRIGSIKISFK